MNFIPVIRELPLIMKKIILLFFTFISVSVLAQETITLKGAVRDKHTKKAIPYVNLGFFEIGIGTITDTNGLFEIRFENTTKTKNLLFSHIGYKNLPVDLDKNENLFLEIVMEPQDVELNEVVVLGTNSTFIGMKKSDDSAQGFFKPKGLGAEVGNFIKNTESCRINSFGMHVLKNTFERMKFRINFYETKKNRPLKLIRSNDFFEIINGQVGEIIVEIKDFKLDSDIFVSIELIEVETEDNENQILTYSAYQNEQSDMFYKLISMDKWTKYKDIGLCFWLNIEK